MSWQAVSPSRQCNKRGRLCGVGCEVVTRQPGLECGQGPGNGGRLAAPAARVWRSGWRRILETGRRDVGYGLSAVVTGPCHRRGGQWDDKVGAVGEYGKAMGGESVVCWMDLAWSCPRSFTVCTYCIGDTTAETGQEVDCQAASFSHSHTHLFRQWQSGWKRGSRCYPIESEQVTQRGTVTSSAPVFTADQWAHSRQLV